ncbi:hypothetical protein [Nocardia acidivorans]|uniref:hypothetical protein n=1 Tax=Nocardia acidivorans TaxID=404580 RepID=UPI00082AEDA5|nr:hypothetical protein [Nocardia acidivorans]
MPIAWRAAAESFEQFLRKHGVGSAAVTDVEAAWRAFVEFSQTEIGGVAPADEDGDGFIVQWGRYSWDNNRLNLTLTRQLAVVDPTERIEADDPDWQHLWQVELTMAFADEPALLALEPDLDAHDTGFRFDPIGPLRAAALAEVRDQAQRQALVEAMLTATPVHSELTFECVC